MRHRKLVRPMIYYSSYSNHLTAISMKPVEDNNACTYLRIIICRLSLKMMNRTILNYFESVFDENAWFNESFNNFTNIS